MTKKQKKNKQLDDLQNEDAAKKDYRSNKKSFSDKDLNHIESLTNTQTQLFEEYSSDSSMFLYGSAGTGKTFLSMYLALLDVLDKSTPYDKLIIVRSAVPTRDIGFLPGELDDKIAVYEQPYRSICNELFQYSNSYDNLKKSNYVEFLPTSFLRGVTFNRCIVLVDEAQNLEDGEFNTVITRIGYNSKIIFCGDSKQQDVRGSGFDKNQRIISTLKDFRMIEFTISDIVRSSLVKSYIIAREHFENK